MQHRDPRLSFLALRYLNRFFLNFGYYCKYPDTLNIHGWICGILSTTLITLGHTVEASGHSMSFSVVEPTELAHALEMVLFHNYDRYYYMNTEWELAPNIVAALHKLVDVGVTNFV